MKLDEAKHILKESGCLLEKEDGKKYYTNAEWKKIKAKLDEFGIELYKKGWWFVLFHPDTHTNFGKAEKVENNAWDIQIYDMTIGKTKLSLEPKDYYGPVALKDLDADEIIEVLENYNDCANYINAVKNKTIKEVETKFNISKAEEW